MLLRPGEILEGRLETYTITATLSRGAYGCAHLARASDGAFRVIKQFEPTETLSEPDLRYQRQCFEREADILTRFHSPLIVHGYELVWREDDIFLVMEHVQGETLRSAFDRHRLDTGQPYDWPAVVAIGRQLCAALTFLHQLPGQIIYRDLKPSNIMWDAAARRLKLIDFGTARFNAAAQRATQGLGTAGYAPPELYGQAIDLSPATDVYTAAAVLYELLTGAPPPDRSTPADFRGRDDELPPALAQALLKALAQQPAERFSSAAAFEAALAAVAPEVQRPPLAARPRNGHPLLACFCPQCGREPASAAAVYCGHDGRMYHVALLQVVPRHRPTTTVYLDRAEAVVGRHDPDAGWYPEVDLAPCDPARHVSRRHLKLQRRGSQFSLTALPTVNGTRLNGQPLEPGGAVALTPGSRLELGDLVATLLSRPVLDPPPDSLAPGTAAVAFSAGPAGGAT